MRLICYKAMCGDAFHLRYVGESGMPRNILLDMGQTRTYTTVLKGVISSIICDSEKIDALFLSHIHDDHIGGASKFIKEIQSDSNLKGVVCRWIYNAPRKYAVDSFHDNRNGVLCGIVSGDKVYEYIITNCPSDVNDIIAAEKDLLCDKDAERIVEFSKKYKDKLLIIHCDAGISRSSGIAAAILRHYTGDDAEIFDNYSYDPNMWCYFKTLKAFGDELF